MEPKYSAVFLVTWLESRFLLLDKCLCSMAVYGKRYIPSLFSLENKSSLSEQLSSAHPSVIQRGGYTGSVCDSGWFCLPHPSCNTVWPSSCICRPANLRAGCRAPFPVAEKSSFTEQSKQLNSPSLHLSFQCSEAGKSQLLPKETKCL